MTLLVGIPYAEDFNLGAAHNQFFDRLREDDWGCVVDHDVMFTTKDWYRQLIAAIQQEPEGCFSGVTNRIKCPFQIVEDGAHMKDHDMTSNRARGAKLLAQYGSDLLDVTDEIRTPSGFLMCLSKKAWRDMGGFPNGYHLMDKRTWQALRLVGRRLYILRGLYLYHWHRGGGPQAEEIAPDAPWTLQHTLPDGRVIGSTKPGTFA